jgi:di/tricarboxylate transporter
MDKKRVEIILGILIGTATVLFAFMLGSLILAVNRGDLESAQNVADSVWQGALVILTLLGIFFSLRMNKSNRQSS